MYYCAALVLRIIVEDVLSPMWSMCQEVEDPVTEGVPTHRSSSLALLCIIPENSFKLYQFCAALYIMVPNVI